MVGRVSRWQIGRLRAIFQPMAGQKGAIYFSRDDRSIAIEGQKAGNVVRVPNAVSLGATEGLFEATER